jgi:hypothetical protein
LIHQSARTNHHNSFACNEHLYTAVNCGLHTHVCILVVHIAPGQIQTFTQFAPASIKAFVHSGVITFPLTNIGSFPNSALNSLMASIILFWNP